MHVTSGCKGGIQVDSVEIPQASHIRQEHRILLETVNPPTFGPDVPSIQYSATVTLYQEHHCANAMIGVDECDLNVIPWAKFNRRRGVKGQWLGQSTHSPIVGDTATLENAASKIGSKVILL